MCFFSVPIKHLEIRVAGNPGTRRRLGASVPSIMRIYMNSRVTTSSQDIVMFPTSSHLNVIPTETATKVTDPLSRKGIQCGQQIHATYTQHFALHKSILHIFDLRKTSVKHPPPISRLWCKQTMSAWSVKTRRAPSRHCRGARVYGHRTTAMHEMSTRPPTPPSRSSSRRERRYRTLPASGRGPGRRAR